jgi:hypothetical protein
MWKMGVLLGDAVGEGGIGVNEGVGVIEDVLVGVGEWVAVVRLKAKICADDNVVFDL